LPVKARSTSRRLVKVTAAAFTVFFGWLLAAEVLAHASERGFILLLPTRYYLMGGTLAVAVSFAMMALARHELLHGWVKARLNIPLPATGLRFWSSCAMCIVLVILLLAGVAGSDDPLSNPLPLSVWTLFWVGLTLLHALFGHLWQLFNPWYAPLALLSRLGGQPSGNKGLVELPEVFGYWPAIIGFLAFAWFELVSLSPEDPDMLVRVVSIYWVSHLIAGFMFGDEWFRRGEPFSIFFRFISLLAPFTRLHARKPGVRLGIPGYRLLAEPAPGITAAIFVLATLATVSFDGLNKTFWWLALHEINPLEFGGRSTVMWVNGRGLLLAIISLVALYFSATAIGWWLARRYQQQADGTSSVNATSTDNNPQDPVGYPEFASLLALAVMPISLGYHFSHYLTQLLVNGQYTWAAFSDPFHRGWDLLGVGHFHVTTSFLSHHASVEKIWQMQMAGIVAGHVLSVALAHLLAMRLYSGTRGLKPSQQGKHAQSQATLQKTVLLSQLPLAVVMIAYTLFGLWLLSTPTGA